MANEVRILVTAEDRASQPIANIKASTVAAGAAMGVALAGAAEAAVSFARDAITSFADVGSQIFDMSNKTGIGAEALSELKFAAEQSGTSMDAIGVAAKRMNTQLFELAGGGKAAKETFAALGLTFDDVKGQTPEENFDLILGKLAEVSDKTAQSALAVQLFGRSGNELLPMLADGAAGLEAMRSRAHELGIVFDAEAAAKADALGDAMDELKGRLQGVGFQLGAALGPALVSIATVMVNLISTIAESKAALIALGALMAGGLVASIIAVAVAIGAIPLAIGAAVAAVAVGVGLFISHFDTIKEAWWELWGSMPGPIKFVLDKVGEFVTGWVKSIRDGINLIIDAINWFTSQINKIKLPDWMGGGQASIGQIPHVEEIAGAIGSAIGDAAMAGFEKIKAFASVLSVPIPGFKNPEIDGLEQQAGNTSKATRELTDAEKALEETRREAARAIADINRQLVDDQIEAYEKGGKVQLDLVKAQQVSMMDAVREKAAELQNLWGLEFPDALSKAFDIVKGGIDGITEAANKLKESTMGLLQANASRNVRYMPGVLEAIAGPVGINTSFGAPASNFGSLEQLAAMTGLPSFDGGGYMPYDGLAMLHAGERVLTPQQQSGGLTVNVTVTGDSYGVDDLGDKVIAAINRAIRRDGNVFLPGAVMS